ncbi:hypothetical protein [Anatilimnocola floriformis]|uniref:hypothetical protein n=1 Tax=Anatilimnocola floriformis TaxID=2948575 RepID=UPI0020C1DA18|nr:hypothetical protein [Anatilimnocola floriformis]
MTDTPAEWKYEPVPPATTPLYRMLWQLETWFRTMAYVELKAARIDWETPIKSKVSKWPPKSLSSDKTLHHMATSHQEGISYLTFGEIWSVMSDPANWPLFEPYFPPEKNTVVRMEEVKTIRNRIAHFREPHRNDVKRLALFMEDMEDGIKRFCCRYCEGKHPRDHADEPIFEKLKAAWPKIGYGIEMLTPADWLYEPGHLRDNPHMNATLQLLTHKNYAKGSLQGVAYKLTFSPNRAKQFDVGQFILRTQKHHKNIIHILLAGNSHPPAVTIPAIHGVDATVELIGEFLSAALNSQHGDGRSLDRDSLNWPEYILWPEHMLTFFSDEIREPILLIDG